MEPEICICAAVKCYDGLIIRGHRHSDCIRNIAGRPDAESRLPIRGNQQGFITSRNRYVTRSEGAELQKAAGIISIMTRLPIERLLTSEDLY